MARKQSEHVYGPEQHRQRWRILFVDGDGRRSRESFASEGEARAAAEAFRARIKGRKVSDAIEEYVADRGADGLRPSTIRTIETRLRTMFDAEGDRTGGPMAEVTAPRARALLEALAIRTVVKAWRRKEPVTIARPRSVDYRLGVLAYTRSFVAWCIKRGYLRRDPFDGLAVKGRRRRGKPQLRVTEAQRWTAVALEAAAVVSRTGDSALCALIALTCATRATEPAKRECRDVDEDGSVLWIPDSKTEAGRRRLVVPEFLRPLLLLRTRSRPATAPLFDRCDAPYILRVVYILCDRAGVPRRTTQSMRGLHSTLAHEAGATGELVARQLGHANTGVTFGHYIAPGAAAAVAQRHVLRAIAGGRK